MDERKKFQVDTPGLNGWTHEKVVDVSYSVNSEVAEKRNRKNGRD